MKLLLALSIISTLAFTAPRAATPKSVSGKVATEKFLKLVPIGKYEGTYKSTNKTKDCVVEISKDNYGLTVEVDDLANSYSSKLECTVTETTTSLALTDYEEDGDEVNGAYSFTRTARVTKLKGAFKISVVELKEYIDEADRDPETEVRTCTIKVE